MTLWQMVAFFIMMIPAGVEMIPAGIITSKSEHYLFTTNQSIFCNWCIASCKRMGKLEIVDNYVSFAYDICFSPVVCAIYLAANPQCPCTRHIPIKSGSNLISENFELK